MAPIKVPGPGITEPTAAPVNAPVATDAPIAGRDIPVY